jgi:hypothetical protein
MRASEMPYGTFDSRSTDRSNYVAEKQQPQVQQQDDQFQRVSRATAAAQQEADQLRQDETVPGGRYVVGGVVVDAEGKPIEGE